MSTRSKGAKLTPELRSVMCMLCGGSSLEETETAHGKDPVIKQGAWARDRRDEAIAILRKEGN